MAFDEVLADRIRDLLAGEDDVREQRMFGGLAFMIGGNMAVAASGQGGLLVRVDPAQSGQLAARKGVEPMEMRGRPMNGWLRVDASGLGPERQLAEWVRTGAGYARTLPRKRSR